MSKAIESLSPADKAALKAVLDPMFEATLDAQIAAIGYWRVDSYAERGEIAPAYGDRCRVVNATETAPGSGVFGPPSRDFVYTQGGGTGGADAWVGERTDAELNAVLNAAFADIDTNLNDIKDEQLRRVAVVTSFSAMGAISGDGLYYGRHVFVANATETAPGSGIYGPPGRMHVWVQNGNGPGADAWLGYMTREELGNELGSAKARDTDLGARIDAIRPVDITSFWSNPAYGELGGTTSALALAWTILAEDGTPLTQELSWGGNVVHLDGSARSINVPANWAAQTNVLVIGDSLSSLGYSDVMAGATGLAVTRAALGAQTSYKQALRVGAHPLYVTLAGNTLPASGSEATVTLLNGAAPDLANPASLLTTAAGDTGPGHHISGTIAGVAVTMSHYPATAPNVYKMTQAGGAPVTVPAGSLFIPNWAAMMRTHELWICVGRNNVTDPERIKADIAAMIGMGRGNRILLFGIINAPNEPAGSANLATVKALNDWMRGNYPKHYVVDGAGRDLRQVLLAGGGLAGNDAVDRANEVIPRSLRVAADDLHLNETGYGIWADVGVAFRAVQAAPATSIADATVFTLNVNGRLRQLTFTKLPRRFWGASSNAALTGAQVIALAGSELSAGRAKAFTVTAADQYVYFAYLASQGDPAGYAINGFSETFEKSVVNVTTAAGHTANYIVIRSSLKLTGAAAVEVI
ncbi:MAG: hypothetical protein DI569_15425 [Sphingopyxis macrogoltabida]|uniref:Uncharacterized protein n=1 Tax=Sphingopyxis macrogoltabida TaxID=33050 RepID=A0A2W5KTZ7_SPHMC|nr:MAG: hypothetical protein DI569_15425 [Sphingopyxis macrogoltabida]